MTRATSLPLALAAVVALVVAACGGGTAASPTPSPRSLEGRTFLSTQVEGRVLVAGSRVRLTFQDGSVGVQAGCNSIGGQYRVDGETLVVGDLAMTEIGCEPPLMDQDEWLAALLAGRPTIALDGDALVLAGGGIRVTFLDREVADPDRPLTGTRWVLDGIIEREAVSSVPLGVTAAITFGEARVDVEAGCNMGGASAQIDDGTITFGPLGLTKMACEPGPMAVEQAMTSVLSGEIAYTIEADVLTLDAGGRGLIFRAASG